MGICNPAEEPQNSSCLNIFKVCIFPHLKGRRIFYYGREHGEWGKFWPVVKCPISMWLRTGWTLTCPLTSCFCTFVNQQRKHLKFLMVGEQFNSVNSICTTVEGGKGGIWSCRWSAVAIHLWISLCTSLTLPKHIYSTGSSICCVHTCNICVEAAKNLPGAPSMNSRGEFPPPAQPLLSLDNRVVRCSLWNGLNRTKGCVNESENVGDTNLSDWIIH